MSATTAIVQVHRIQITPGETRKSHTNSTSYSSCTPDNPQVNDLVQLSIRAFKGDKSQTAFLGGNWDLAPIYFSAIIRAALLEGLVYGVKNEQEEVVAFGCFFKPGVSIFQTEAQRALGWDEFFGKLTPEIQDWYNHTYPEAIAKHISPLLTQEEKSRRWWCPHLCTDPSYERRGFAKAIIDTVYQEVIQTGGILGLMTEPDRVVKKYESMGFIERGICAFSSPAIGEFDLHLLIRQCVNPISGPVAC